MSTQTVKKPVTIVWDDSVVIVFSFVDNAGTTQTCGFTHLGFAIQAGSNTQVSNVLQTVQAVQASADPQSWVETIKNSHRTGNNVDIVFDDSTSQPFTTSTAQPFQLQILLSLSG
ncbi:MAG TPA: hypothetical protein VOA87_18845 [Thermoanaerobaculia bacterium]|nr:hypothetical protein [Thermoanaerobaculia bacterium]